LVFTVNKNVDFTDFVNYNVIKDYHSLFKDDFKAQYVVYVTAQGYAFIDGKKIMNVDYFACICLL